MRGQPCRLVAPALRRVKRATRLYAVARWRQEKFRFPVPLPYSLFVRGAAVLQLTQEAALAVEGDLDALVREARSRPIGAKQSPGSNREEGSGTGTGNVFQDRF